MKMIYGFGMVDSAYRCRTQSAINRKIYGEFTQSQFRQNFAELSSMQSLAIYRELLVKR
jgi:hypothetical protein